MEDNKNKRSNRLIFEKSPYLLQHAHNPVDWYPWGEEAFEKAKKEDKPIFLSIGYSTCHWRGVNLMSKFRGTEEFRLNSEPMTAEELLSLSDDSYRYELVKGELRKMPPAGFEHGVRGTELTWRLAQYVRINGLGRVTAAETGYKIATDPDTVRAPDIGFVRADRITDGELPKGYFPGPPDLAVEIVSPGDTFPEVEDKVIEWLMAGCTMVWVVNPGHRTITIYRSLTDIRILTEADVLDGAEVIPGFQCVISDLFI